MEVRIPGNVLRIRSVRTIREAVASDQPALVAVLSELHPDGADGTTLPAVRQAARTFVATDGDGGRVFVSAVDTDAERFYGAKGFTPCTGPWLYWAPASQTNRQNG